MEVSSERVFSLKFWLLCLSSFLFSASFNMLIPELPAFLSALGGAQYKGLIIGLFTLTAGIARPFSGKLTDSVGRVPVMAIGSLVCVVTQGELTPALAFDKGPVITIVDVPVQGTFPSKFRLEMYEPPPESTLHHPTRQEEGEPLVSIGHITAVTSDHPEKFYVGNSLSLTAYDCKDEGRSDNLCLDQTEETCPEPNVDKIPCYVEKRYCPKGDRESDQCIIEKSGDPDLAINDVYTKFAGLSQNYEVIYLSEAAAPGSATAAWFEAKGGVPAGYGLYEITPLMGKEADEHFHEDSEAWELAIQYYNDAHGTDYKTVKCEKAWDAPFCTKPIEDIEGRTGPYAEIHRLLEKAKIDQGRSISGQHYKRVDDPANTAISIVIAARQALPLEPPTQP